MPEYRDIQKRDWIATFSRLGLFVAVLVAGAIWLAPEFYILFLVLGAASLLLLVLWHNRTFAYRCSNCGDEFEISALRNFLSPHGPDAEGGWKYLKCPACRAWNRARLVKKI
jgi:DNA-directed RNA polymerase subunit RPC12/RpoP